MTVDGHYVKINTSEHPLYCCKVSPESVNRHPSTSPTEILNNQQLHRLHNIRNPVRIDGIMNEFAIAFGSYDAGPAENGQVLRGYRLFQPEVNIEFRYREFFMLVEYADDLLAEFMIEGPQDHRGFFEVYKVDFYRRIISSVGVDDHPIITDCTIHDGKHIKGACN